MPSKLPTVITASGGMCFRHSRPCKCCIDIGVAVYTRCLPRQSIGSAPAGDGQFCDRHSPCRIAPIWLLSDIAGSRFPKVIGRTMTRIDRDFHMHTDLSSCASREATLPRMVAAARQCGLKHVGISDHFHELKRDFAEMARTNLRSHRTGEAQRAALTCCSAAKLKWITRPMHDRRGTRQPVRLRAVLLQSLPPAPSRESRRTNHRLAMPGITCRWSRAPSIPDLSMSSSIRSCTTK